MLTNQEDRDPWEYITDFVDVSWIGDPMGESWYCPLIGETHAKPHIVQFD